MLTRFRALDYEKLIVAAARGLKAGDIVEIAPNVVHWHGAAPDSRFSHLAIECSPQTNKNTWLDPVSDEEYSAATAGK